jgi:hypothetical protein
VVDALETGVFSVCGGETRDQKAGPARAERPAQSGGHSVGAGAIVKLGSGALAVLIFVWIGFYGSDHVVETVLDIVNPGDEVCDEFKSAHLGAVIKLPGCWRHRNGDDRVNPLPVEKMAGQSMRGTTLTATQRAMLGSTTSRTSELKRGLSLLTFGTVIIVGKLEITSWQVRDAMRQDYVGVAKAAADNMLAGMETRGDAL